MCRRIATSLGTMVVIAAAGYGAHRLVGLNQSTMEDNTFQSFIMLPLFIQAHYTSTRT